MNFNDIETGLSPLIAAMPPREARWLGRLLRSPAAYDAFTALENELFVGKEGAYSGPLLIASATRGEGRTTMALLLAVLSSAFDRSRRILLVDADTDDGHLSRLFGPGPWRGGLSELFDGSASIDECIEPTALPNLWLTPQARDPQGAIRLSPVPFKQFIEEARNRFDLVVVDSPAAGLNRGVLSLASVVRNVLVVVKYGGPTREQVASLTADLQRIEASVLGCVLNQREFVVPRFFYGAS